MLALVFALGPSACAVPPPRPHETRFYAADNPTELSRIVNGSSASGCRMIQVVPWKDSFIAVMDCPRSPPPSAPPCAPSGGGKCPGG